MLLSINTERIDFDKIRGHGVQITDLSFCSFKIIFFICQVEIANIHLIGVTVN